MQSKATTVTAYLKALPPERRKAIAAVRKAVKAHLPKGYKECMQYGMIGYVVPLSLYPPGYHTGEGVPLPYAALASQKNYMSLYLMCIYGDRGAETGLRKKFKERGKKLDMGKSCVRFKKLEDLPLDVVGAAIASVPVKDFIAQYEKTRGRKR